MKRVGLSIEIGGKVETRMISEKVIWLKSDSVTFLLTYDSGAEVVCKSFSEEDIRRGYELSGEADNLYPGALLPKDSQRSLFWREFNVLSALQGSFLVPRLMPDGLDRERLRISMSYLPYDTYQKKLAGAESESEKLDLTRKMIDFLGIFQQYTQRNHRQILQAANSGRERLRLRTFAEEASTLEKYFVNTIFAYGSNFRKAARKAGIYDQLATNFSLRRQAVFQFFKDGKDHKVNKGNLERRIGSLVNSERTAVGEPRIIVHGDYRPQNIFANNSEEGNIGKAICDFDKVLLHGSVPVYDLASGIFHSHLLPLTPEKLRFAVQLARGYLENNGTRTEEIPNQLALFVGESLLTLVRTLGVESVMPYSMIRRFVPNINAGEEDKDSFIIHRDVSSLELLINEVTTRGETYRTAVEPSNRHKGYVVRQAQTIKAILKVAGVNVNQLSSDLAGERNV